MSLSGSIIDAVKNIFGIGFTVIKWGLVVLFAIASVWFVRKLIKEIKEVKEMTRAKKEHEDYIKSLEENGK